MVETVLRIAGLGLILCVMLAVLTACATIGTGKSTLVLGKKPATSYYNGDEFAMLIASGDKPELRSMGAGKPYKEKKWNALMKERFGVAPGTDSSPILTTAHVSVSVRDRTRTPNFDGFNFDSAKTDEIATLLLNKDLSDEQKAKLLNGVRNNYATRPEVETRAVFDMYVPPDADSGEDDGATDHAGVALYRYFIELELDFTGTLQSADPTVRFDYLAAAIRIPNGMDARFVNFAPKEADLFDLTIGQLKSSSSLAANAKQSATASVGSDIEDTSVENRTKKDTASTGATTEYGLSFSLTEELTREIKSALDVRAAGIHQAGKLFILELRSTDQKRISGTYSYKVMLEVRSEPAIFEELIGISNPKVNDLSLEVRTVGVLRHVVAPGRTGTFNRVPEPLNDKTFHQVVIDEALIDAWSFTNAPRAERLLAEQQPDNLVVRTGFADAMFVVREPGGNGDVLGYGQGKQKSFKVDPKKAVEVVFYPVILIGDPALELAAPPVSTTIPDSGTTTVVGAYSVDTFYAAASKEKD